VLQTLYRRLGQDVRQPPQAPLARVRRAPGRRQIVAVLVDSGGSGRRFAASVGQGRWRHPKETHDAEYD
jgi:hypothetical protein